MRNVRRYCDVYGYVFDFKLTGPSAVPISAHWARSVDWQLLEIGTDLRGADERETSIPILRDSNLLQTGCELDMTQRASQKNVNVTKLSWIINWFTYCKAYCWLNLFGYRNSSKWFWLFLLTKTVQYCLIILIYHNFWKCLTLGRKQSLISSKHFRHEWYTPTAESEFLIIRMNPVLRRGPPLLLLQNPVQQSAWNPPFFVLKSVKNHSMFTQSNPPVRSQLFWRTSSIWPARRSQGSAEDPCGHLPHLGPKADGFLRCSGNDGDLEFLQPWDG